MPESTALRVAGRGRAALGWVILVALVIGVAFVGLQVAVEAPGLRDGLDPEGRGYSGTLAAAEILRQQGIEVVVVRDRFDAAREIDDDSTLAFTDPVALSDDAVLTMMKDAPRVVSLSGSSRMLRLLELGESVTDVGNDAVGSGCSAPEFAGVQNVIPGRLFTADSGVTACFTGSNGARESAGVLISEGPQTRVIVDGSRLFTNEKLATADNAALALAVLGQQKKLVWYVPSIVDTDLSDTADSDTLAALTPRWVTPAILLLVLATIAAGVWRGRRFGPLVAETLPVTVRASETMHGRARLTAKVGDAAHAASALREGTLRRLAVRLRLSPSATAEAVSDAVADRLGAARASVREVLLAPVPTADAHLVEYARRLADVEAAIDQVSANERMTP